MPARIYALAKELNLDSKDLVDLVKKAGITGKGSALASLTDDETQRVRDYLGGSSAPRSLPSCRRLPRPFATPFLESENRSLSKWAGAPPGPRSVRPRNVRSRVLPLRNPQLLLRSYSRPLKRPPRSRLSQSLRPPSRQGREWPTGSAAAWHSAPGRAIRPRRSGSDSLSGGASGGKVRSLDRPSGAGGEKRAADTKGKRREPRININLASLPDSPQPGPVQAAPGEPKAQKPDVRLSKDVIQGHKQGMKAPLEQLAQEDTEKKRGTKRVAGGLTGFTGDKPKRGKAGVDEDDKPRKKTGIAGMASAAPNGHAGESVATFR